MLAAAGTKTGILSEPGRWRSPARDMLPGAGALGVAGDNNGQLPALGQRSAGFQRLGRVLGRRSGLGPPHPRQLALPFVLRFVPPLPPGINI